MMFLVTGFVLVLYVLLRRRNRRHRTFLKAEDYPVLAAIWDNEHDAVYDSL